MNDKKTDTFVMMPNGDAFRASTITGVSLRVARPQIGVVSGVVVTVGTSKDRMLMAYDLGSESEATVERDRIVSEASLTR